MSNIKDVLYRKNRREYIAKLRAKKAAKKAAEKINTKPQP